MLESVARNWNKQKCIIYDNMDVQLQRACLGSQSDKNAICSFIDKTITD